MDNTDTQLHESAATADSQSVDTVRARDLILDLRKSADESSNAELITTCNVLAQLVELAEGSTIRDESEDQVSVTLQTALGTMQGVLEGNTDQLDELSTLAREVLDRWGEHFALLDDTPMAVDDQVDPFDTGWDEVADDSESVEQDIEAELNAPSADEVSRLISSLGSQPSGTPEQAEPPRLGEEQEARIETESHVAVATQPASVPEIDDELREAFLDDASQCIGSMEEALLAFESDTSNREPILQIGRELHTLKGASASVGLNELAEFIHGVEDTIDSESGGDLPSVQSMLASLDHVRAHISRVENPSSAAESQRATHVAEAGSDEPVEAPAVAPAPIDDRTGDDESVRVRSSQLSRLMDMLSELVMLRNRRETELIELQEIHHLLLQDVSKIRMLSDSEEIDSTNSQAPRLTEVANDLMATAQRLRECSQPVAEGNAAISQFIRQFRQELVQLRRTPVSGLFRRLQRVTRDAARAEEKQVRLQLIGEDAGMERSLQQRLYEPLLHIVRNCVCHGIETPQQRSENGKDETGTVTLEARSSSDLFVIEIRDDGKGLNYDAIRRRGLESGLLHPGHASTDEELSQLIFQPGFSTRQSANQVAGRGVGMDVVADTLKRMRGWVEVKSVAGRGTTIRLSFPLPSVIQHTMVVRSSGQLFAVPMQFIQNAGDKDQRLPSASLDDLIGKESGENDSATQRLVLACDLAESGTEAAQNRRISLRVDEIIGPEEVVVRPLPSLLKHHPICCGATLSGQGETVLVLDPHRLVQQASRNTAFLRPNTSSLNKGSNLGAEKLRPKVLVVDDSKTARRRVVRSLSRYNVEVVEANDGLEAVRLMNNQYFSAIFSDMEMPQVDGMGLLSKVHHNGRDQAPPVIIISSRSEESFRKTAKQLGAANYLIKPLADNELDQAIASIPSLRSIQLLSEPTTCSHGESV